MAKELSLIFERKPEQWGLRGDLYLWDEMEYVFGVDRNKEGSGCLRYHQKRTRMHIFVEGRN